MHTSVYNVYGIVSMLSKASEGRKHKGRKTGQYSVLIKQTIIQVAHKGIKFRILKNEIKFGL